jgi:hypothetical protein
MKNNYTLGLVLACCMFLSACSKNGPQVPNTELTPNSLRTSSTEPAPTPYREGDLILGKKLNNPYTLANMKSAISRLQGQGLSQLKAVDLRASHFYVKFKPADSAQCEQIGRDKRMTVYPYPLDYEIAVRGNRYHDTSLPKGTITYHYAAVKSDYVFDPKIPYEVISALYIPEEDASLKSKTSEAYVDQLLNQAYKQTGNFQDTIVAIKASSPQASYHPGGKIQVWDTRLQQYIGLEGVDMRARRWFTTHHARTDFWGNYQMENTFKNPCNYSLWFTQDDFTVKPHLVDLTAWIDGPKQKANWNLDIANGYDRFVSHIFRGAYRYHYGFIDGLKRPYGFATPRIWYIGVDDGSGASGNNYAIVPVIRIRRYKDLNIEYGSDEIFSTTCHETTHTSHLRQLFGGALDFAFVSGKIRESWAIGVEWWLTKLEYKNTRGVPNYGDWNYSTFVQYPNLYAYQFWNKNISPDADKYTNLFIDLVDDYNEFNQNFISQPNGTVDDEVKGYKMSVMEEFMTIDVNNLDDLKSWLKLSKPNGVTDQQIDLLLSHY